MALEDRIRTSVGQALKGLTTDLLTISQDEVSRQVGEAESRLRAEFDQRAADLGEKEREASARQLAEAQHQFEARLETAVADAEARAVAATEASAAAARVGEREQEIACMTRLVESIRGLDGATSLSEVLDALALAAARETARAAVVVVKGDHVVGWRLSGFGHRDAQPKAVDLLLSESGVIGLAATSARVATSREGDADGPGFEDLPADRRGLAAPVLVGGRVVAVVYADGLHGEGPDGHAVPNPWPEVVEVLARHAGRCLEALTAQKTGGSGSGSGVRLSGSHAVAAAPAPASSSSPLGATG